MAKANKTIAGVVVAGALALGANVAGDKLQEQPKDQVFAEFSQVQSEPLTLEEFDDYISMLNEAAKSVEVLHASDGDFMKQLHKIAIEKELKKPKKDQKEFVSKKFTIR